MLRQFSMKVKLACASDLLGTGDEIGQCDQRGHDTLKGLLVLVGCPFPEIEGERAVPREPTQCFRGRQSLGKLTKMISYGRRSDPINGRWNVGSY